MSQSGDTFTDTAFIGGGEMGKVVRVKDWSRTPLGPIESWPPSLRTAVSLVLNSNFPISLAWGPQHVQIYNDGYWPICAAKHPASMGQDFSECWASAFPVIGDAFRSALAGTTAFLEDQRMFLDRLGYLEETFFTFSFSPIRDEHGAVAGLFHPVTETTSKMVGQRRTRTLRELTAIGLAANSLDEALRLSAQALTEAALDVPFALFYRIEDDRRTARLVAQTGLVAGGPASPTVVDLVRDDAGWPLARVAASGKPEAVADVRARFPGLICGPYPEPVALARVLPIAPSAHEPAVGFVVVGVSTRLPLNEGYESFYELLGATVGSVVASALADEAERKRAEALAEIDRAKTEFFSNISHEFRTPLTLMLGPLEEALAESTGAHRERIATAHRNSLRLLKLVNSLLDFSRIEAGRAKAHFQPTDLARHTAELASTFRSALEKAGLTLTVDCPALPEPVFVDREMWEKVVLNLLSNAFKHTFTGGIRVALRWAGEHAVLDVVDTGVGIPAAEVPLLFDRFHRVKGARSRTHEGTGIGLALVKELAHLHGGTVRAASDEGAGSTFTVTLKTGRAHLPAGHVAEPSAPLPLAPGAAAYIEEAAQWIPSTTTVPANATGRARIVWADDNADMREYVRRLLGEHYDVTAVSNGAEALAAARATPPDLVLTDIMMPGLDGFGVLRELRADARTRHIPVILLSARAGEEETVGGLESGADDYLAKPFSARELLARVRTHIELARVRREQAAEQARTSEIERREADSRTRLATETESRRALLGILEDQQRTAVALRESEARLRSILDTMFVFVGLMDLDGRIVEVNEAPLAAAGLRRADVLGRAVQESFWFSHSSAVQEQVRLALARAAQGQVVREDYLIRIAGGDCITIDCTFAPLRDSSGRIAQIVGSAVDITARVRATEALRESERNLIKAQRIAHVGSWRWNLAGPVQWSDELYRIYGVSPETFTPTVESFLDLIHPEDRPGMRVWMQSCVAGESPDSFDFRAVRPDGTMRFVNGRGELVRDAGGSPISMVGTAQDITERKQAEAALRESELRFSTLFEKAPAATALARLSDGVIVQVNEAFERLFGFRREEAVGRTSLELGLHPDPQVRLRANEELAAGVSAREREATLRIKSGELRATLVNIDLIEIGGQRHILSTALDITERKQAETALREAEARLRLSVAASNIGLWDWNLATNEVYFSPEWKGQLGHADHEIGNQFGEWESRVHPDDLAPTLAKIKRFLAEPTADYAVEFRLRHKDGSYRWIYTQAQLLRDAAGKPARMLGCHLDITERKRAEAALRQSEERFSTAFRASPVGICLTTLEEGRFLDANNAFLQTIGFTREEVVGHTAAELNLYVQPGDREALVGPLRERGTVSRHELRFRRKSGKLGDSTRSLELVELGGEKFILTYFEDITERKRAEAEVLASREQLRALLERLQRAQEEERTRMAREIHDELGQLLTGLKMDTRWLERKLSEPGVPATFAPLLDRAVAASELADTTITAVRKLAAELRPGALDHLGLVAALAERARLFAERTGVHCTVTAPEPPPALPSATATELFYICQEALTNVARHAQASVVVIQLAVEGGAVLLTVGDDGAGVGEVDWNRPQSLGLVGMRERALHCGGTLNVGPNTPRGTKVVVKVPLRSDG